MEDQIVKIYTGSEIIINRLASELEAKGINSLVKDGFQQGIEAGFVGGVPSAIDLFVRKSDLSAALEVVKALTE